MSAPSALRRRIYCELPLPTDPQYGFGLTAAEIAARTGFTRGAVYAELQAMEAACLAIPYRRAEHAPARWIRRSAKPESAQARTRNIRA